MVLKTVSLLFFVKYCGGVIQDLNESSYDEMPRLFDMDDYIGCLKPNDGLYCTMQIQLYPGDNGELYQTIQEYSDFESHHFNHTFIDRGVCVTKKCKKYVKNTTADLAWILGECVNNSMYRQYGLEAKVSRFACDRPDEKAVIDASDWIVAGAIVFVILINVIGSLYHVHIQNQCKNDDSSEKKSHNNVVGNRFLLCFSVYNSWKWLTYKSEHPQMACLQGLHGVRSIATILMVLAHVVLIYGGFVDNEHYIESVIPNYWLIQNGAVLIQLFFVMTGILLAFKMQMTAEKDPVPWSMLPKIIFFRWLRLTPAYAMMIAFSATWMRHMGSGPLWKSGVTETAVADCRQYWWHHILYFNNYAGDVGKHCAAQTWYIPADMQLFTVGVIALMATQTRGRWLVLGLLTAVGVLAPALHVWKDGLDGAMLFTPEFLRSLKHDTFYQLHIQGHNNLSSFAVGMATGVLIYQWQKTGKDLKQYKKYLGYTVHVCIVMLLLVIYSGSALFLAQTDQPLWVRMAYQGLHRFIFSIFLAIGFVGLALKTDDSIRKVLEWDGWVVPSRLCYSVYIVHLIFVLFMIGTKLRLYHMTFFDLINHHLSVVCMSFITAVPFCLALEAPTIALINALKGSPKKSS